MRRYLANIKATGTRQATLLALAVMLLNGLLYTPPLYRWVGAYAALTVNGLTDITAGLISIWFGFQLWRSSRHGENIRLIWGSLTAGLVFWGIAELAWDTYQTLQGIKMPITSPVDIAWMLGYAGVITGLVMRVYTLRMRPTKGWQFAILAAFGVLAILAVIYLIVPISSAPQTDPSYNRYTGLFYAISDLVLGLLALLLVLVLDGGVLSRPWALIALACLCIAVSNLLFAYALSQGSYQITPADGLNALSYVIDTFYTFAYVLMALGLYLQARLLDAI